MGDNALGEHSCTDAEQFVARLECVVDQLKVHSTLTHAYAIDWKCANAVAVVFLATTSSHVQQYTHVLVLYCYCHIVLCLCTRTRDLSGEYFAGKQAREREPIRHTITI